MTTLDILELLIDRVKLLEEQVNHLHAQATGTAQPAPHPMLSAPGWDWSRDKPLPAEPKVTPEEFAAFLAAPKWDYSMDRPA